MHGRRNSWTGCKGGGDVVHETTAMFGQRVGNTELCQMGLWDIITELRRPKEDVSCS